MLNREIFAKGIEKLTIEYKDRGFTMTKEKAAQWYEHMQSFSDKEFNRRIYTCLMTCSHVPYMADITNIDNKDLKLTPEDIKEKEMKEKNKCISCGGRGTIMKPIEGDKEYMHIVTCPHCEGKGYKVE